MLGQELCWAAPDWATVTGLTREHGDLAVAEQAREALLVTSPQVVIHCAACTDVDGCTRDPDRAWADNATATRNVAQAAAEIGALVLYLSTDYVFDGTKGAPYLEGDEPNPLNVYGESKLAGEEAIRELTEHVIVRTQWLYGPGGGNFVASILRAAAAGRDLRVVEDEVGRPTYAPDLADGIWRLLASGARGIFHLAGQGSCSRYELARAALDEAGMSETPVGRMLSADWDSPTVRPLDTRLGDSRLAEAGVAPLRPWREALREYLTSLA
jgi:dTDP-4-dehydrorhamnose reductase